MSCGHHSCGASTSTRSVRTAGSGASAAPWPAPGSGAAQLGQAAALAALLPVHAESAPAGAMVTACSTLQAWCPSLLVSCSVRRPCSGAWPGGGSSSASASTATLPLLKCCWRTATPAGRKARARARETNGCKLEQC